MARKLTLLLTLVLATASIATVTAQPVDSQFLQTWRRTDLPVSTGQTSRTWMWGPDAFTSVLTEEYAESPGGERQVQYFDKSRMEITDPAGDQTSQWYVTNGLLSTELITGRMQIGHDTFEQREPADIPVAGDPGSTTTPTYATLQPLLTGEKHTESGTITAVLDAEGNVTADPDLVRYGIIAQPTNAPTNHTIASVFWEFLVSEGMVFEDGEYVRDDLFVEPWYPTGYPITEAFWTETEVAGTSKQVLLQCFERRCLTYTPDNPDGWRVEAGNVGQHYYSWRYDQQGPSIPQILYISEISGGETSAGQIEEGVRYGATFVGTATGDVAGTFNASIDYSPPNPGAGVTNTVVSGTWSVTSDSGGVSGVFLGGTAVWDEAGEIAEIHVIMKVHGRSGEYDDAPREARFDGTLDHRGWPPVPPRINGVLMLYR